MNNVLPVSKAKHSFSLSYLILIEVAPTVLHPPTKAKPALHNYLYFEIIIL